LYRIFVTSSSVHFKFTRVFLLAATLAVVMLCRVVAQDADTLVSQPKEHIQSPRKAVLYSLVCPGLGQIYNRKYWKLPVIYGAGGTLMYFIAYNQTKYVKFRDANEVYVNTQGDPDGITVIDGLNIPNSNLSRGMDYYRRYRDLSVLGFGVVYLLNVVDAMVDAYFFNFDVSDDLSMRLEPAMLNGPGLTSAMGVGINIRF